MNGFNCDKCGHFTYYDAEIDVDYRRTYDGRDVCVSCLVDLKMKNGDYQ